MFGGWRARQAGIWRNILSKILFKYSAKILDYAFRLLLLLQILEISVSKCAINLPVGVPAFRLPFFPKPIVSRNAELDHNNYSEHLGYNPNCTPNSSATQIEAQIATQIMCDCNPNVQPKLCVPATQMCNPNFRCLQPKCATQILGACNPNPKKNVSDSVQSKNIIQVHNRRLCRKYASS